MSDTKETITLPAGYNGDTMPFFAEPIVVDGELVKLRCAEPGKEFLIRWAYASDVVKARHVG